VVPKDGQFAAHPVEATVPGAVTLAARSRDAAAAASYEAVFQGHYVRLVGTLAVACGDRDLAADVVQQAFVQLWVNWKKVGRYESPSAWVTRVAVSRLRDHQRSLRRRAAALLRLEAEPSPDPPAESLTGSLAVALRKLPMRQRLAVVLHYVDDRPIADVAAIMGCTEGTVNRYLFRARTTLRALLEAE
jgi:RNA polymerase sigma-70 factor (ECF subfamily)